MKTVKEIMREYLIENEYDGLYNDDECCCSIEDLCPCDGNPMHCQVGYKQECKYCGDRDACEFGCIENISCIMQNKQFKGEK